MSDLTDVPDMARMRRGLRIMEEALPGLAFVIVAIKARPEGAMVCTLGNLEPDGIVQALKLGLHHVLTTGATEVEVPPLNSEN